MCQRSNRWYLEKPYNISYEREFIELQSDIFLINRINRHKTVTSINTFPALIKSKNSVSFDYFGSILISRRWSAVILCHSISPESPLKALQDGGG